MPLQTKWLEIATSLTLLAMTVKRYFFRGLNFSNYHLYRNSCFVEYCKIAQTGYPFKKFFNISFPDSQMIDSG